jgi:D-alanyl-lipoteichoic acid acyltransferase DltB (MBOAT superfamily)
MAFIPVYILILFATIIIDYFAGILIEQSAGRKRKIILVTTIVLNVLVLCIFKYYNFFLSQTATLLSGLGFHGPPMPYLNILLPIGLSFHTFQALSYIIEINRGNVSAERHFGIYSLYVMFFPQLVAGPIERPQNMLHQFHEVKEFNQEKFISGFKIMIWGFIMKLVIADRLGIYVNEVYRDPGKMGTLNVYLGVVLFFPFQVYCDFAGYSAIAIGTARMMGFQLMENFRTPFASLTTSELWNRWHISLSSWFRDYVYQPVVIRYRNYGKLSVVLGLLLAFFLSGLWHGAGLSFILYGLFQGTIMVVEFLAGVKSTKRGKTLYGRIKGVVITYILFSLSLIFFRSLGLKKALVIFKKMFVDLDFKFVSLAKIPGFTFYASALSILALIIFETRGASKILYNSYAIGKEIFIASILLIILILFGVFYNVSFIYFQF